MSNESSFVPIGLDFRQRLVKRCLDFVLSVVLLGLSWWLIVLTWLLASFDTGRNGFFFQQRVGRKGRCFNVIKIRTMRPDTGVTTTVTTGKDPRITRLGSLLRRAKLDELPQLFNVLLGQMSFVGPRPDVPGFADRLEGGDRVILSLRPGITGPATIRYRDEEQLLARVPDPEAYNREVIFPDKVRLNRAYLEHWRLRDDLIWIWRTLSGWTPD